MKTRLFFAVVLFSILTMPIFIADTSYSIDGISYTLTGYIEPDFNFESNDVRAGIKVELLESGKYALTDSSGYFRIEGIPQDNAVHTVLVSKQNYLERRISNVIFNSDLELGTDKEPVTIYAGDIAVESIQDKVINMKDIIEMAKCFNSVLGDNIYKSNVDFNCDNMINMVDIIIVAKHFNQTSYSELTPAVVKTPVVTPTTQPTNTPMFTPVLKWEKIVDIGTVNITGRQQIVVDDKGIIYTAYESYSEGIKVYKTVGSYLEQIGSFTGEISDVFLKIDNDGTPYLTLLELGHENNCHTYCKPIVMKYIDGKWVDIYIPDDIKIWFDATFSIYDKTPYIVYKEYEKYNHLKVIKFDGYNWVDVGETVSENSSQMSVSFDKNGAPFVAYSDYKNEYKLTVKKFNGDSWVSVGEPCSFGNTSRDLSLVFDNAGTPYAIFGDVDKKINIVKYNGQIWQKAFDFINSEGYFSNISMVFDSFGTPYVTYGYYSSGSKSDFPYGGPHCQDNFLPFFKVGFLLSTM